MKVKGSYKPNALEYEIVNDGRTAIIRFYENIKKYDEPAGEDGQLGISGWEFDRYTLERPHTERLQSQIEAEIPKWLEYARQEERDDVATAVRAQRNALLFDTDKTQISDAPITEESREAYREYRQRLRDIPDQPGFPYEIDWPELPAK